VQEQQRNSMQKFSKKYLKFWENLKKAQAKYSIEPSEKNLKKLTSLKAIKWTDSTRYTNAYLKENKASMDKARLAYQGVPNFFNNI
jgi:hypothetical protein